MDAQSRSPSPGTVSGAPDTRKVLSAELIAVLGVGATLGVLMLAGMHGIRVDMRDLRMEVREIGVRLAGLEQRVAGLEVQVAGLEVRVAGLEEQFEEFRDTISREWSPRREGEG